ncbi:MAG TPA: response regulator [Stellaceae bacterium]|nr:response regulator [Stellaceae bacterium]
MDELHNRILLVEDDPDVRPLLEHALLSAGFRVHMAISFVEALDLLDARVYDLVLTDVMLPDGNGIKIADAAKARDIKSLVITAYAFQIPKEQLAQHEVLLKPVRPREVVSAVERRLGA